MTQNFNIVTFMYYNNNLSNVNFYNDESENLLIVLKVKPKFIVTVNSTN